MLTYNLDHIEMPMYEYICRCIKKDIMSGRLKAGEKLPSKRSFSQNNGVSIITIQNAYDQLISEGYIVSCPRKGYYVADVPTPADIPSEETAVSPFFVPMEKKHYTADLSNNRTNPDNFPFSVWAKLMRTTISEKSRELMIPSPAAGIPELQEAIAGHLRSFRGICTNPSQIVIGAGTEYLYSLLIQLLGYDKIYCIENPGYRKPAKIYEHHGITCRFAGMDDNGLSVSELKRTGAQIAHISPTHHFPTGISMPITRRYEILKWASDSCDRFIIEDDYDSEFRQNGRPIPPLQSIDTSGKVIYMNTFSKSLTPTIRISYMVLPPLLAKKFYRELSFYSCTVSNFEQYTMAAFISKGYFEKHINRMRLYYGRQRRRILDCIQNSSLHNCCRVIENDSGLHFILELSTEIPDREIQKRLEKKNIHIDALSDYYFTKNRTDRHRFLLSYSDLDLSLLPSAAEALATTISSSNERQDSPNTP